MPVGSTSVTVIAPELAAVPRLRTTKVQVAFWPWTNAAVWRLSSVTSGTPVTAVTSVSESFAAVRSPEVVADAEFETDGTAAAPTATVTVKIVESPGARAPPYVPVRLWPAGTKPQPAPAADT